MEKIKVLDPTKVLTGNKGYIKINNQEIAELKELEIKIVPEMKEISLLSFASKGKMITNVAGVITFELYKVFSRFKPTVLECAKLLQPFTFTLEACVKTQDEENEERIYISQCWLEGDITLLALKAEGDFLTEKFTAGFEISSAGFVDVIYDKYDWNIVEKNDKKWKLGWNKNGTGWWYCTDVDNNYYFKNQWQWINGECYSFDPDGYARRSVWLQDGGYWYYLQDDCVMARNKWLRIGGKSYYFGDLGGMYRNCYTPDGYWVSEDGSWDESVPQKQ